MELTLNPAEASLLRQILDNHLSDLRMEISSTEDYDLRQQLKQDEATINVLLGRLGQERGASA